MAGPAAPPAPATGQAFRSRDVGPRYPIARTVILVDVPYAAEFAQARYDALYVAGNDTEAASVWARRGASLVVPVAEPVHLPFAEKAVDVVIANLAAPRARHLLPYILELARVAADDGALVFLHSDQPLAGHPDHTAFTLVDAWLAGRGKWARKVDVCRDDSRILLCPATTDRRACVAPGALLRQAPSYDDALVLEKRKAPPALEHACCSTKTKCTRRCFAFTRGHALTRTIADPTRQALVLREAPVGRLRYWDERRIVTNYDDVWASRYKKEHEKAWHDIYVGHEGFLPDKREWPPAFDALVRTKKIKSILDAGGGTASLDAHLRKQGLRSRVTLVAFGFYDCSMARVAAERGSLIFDWTWLDPLPFCEACTFDVVFQAEGIHHSVPRKVFHNIEKYCPKAGRRLDVNASFVADDPPRRRLDVTRDASLARPPRRRLDLALNASLVEPPRRRLAQQSKYLMRKRLKREGQRVHGEIRAQSASQRRKNRQTTGLECALKLWKLAFDNLGKHVACGGYLYVSDLVGDNFDVPPGMPGKPPRCWSAFGERWAAENGFKHVKRQGGPSGECKMIYPYLWLQRTC